MIIRNIDISIDIASWLGKPIPTGISTLSSKSNMYIDLLEVLIHVAKRTSLPISYGFALGDLWAWLRYLPAVSNSSDLKLRQEWEELDSHQKTILSDDMGMGFSSSILSKALKLLFICPTNYIVENHPSISLGKTGKRGPNKSPDFIAVDIHGKLHIIECKGTQKDSKQLDSQLDTGFNQKSNVVAPAGFIDQSLVSGIFIPQYSNTEKAIFKIKDPEFPLNFSNVSKEDIIESIILGEIASSIHLLGFPKLANSIAKNEKLNDSTLEKIKEDINVLATEEWNGKVFRKLDIIHRVDYSEFIDPEIYAIKVELGMELEFINKLFSESDFKVMAENFRKQIENGQLKTLEAESTNNWTRVPSPLGFYIKLEVLR
ncbi:hypothetical protein V7127_25730 [Bacillus sp. JJ1773]|uniref:hypothetical protein n=1 Tax=Bacillus sp. JJ1773 TaxID=3122965 RepID=UPI002FFF9349